MKNKLSWGIALLPFVPSVWMQGQEQKQGIGNRRPNIIFIMSDDHARQAMSIYGHPIGKIAPTPHIDRIGHEGAVFQNNYCCNSISGPSRAAILTGKHSHKNGFMRNGNKDLTVRSRHCRRYCKQTVMKQPLSASGILFQSLPGLTIG